MKPSDFTKEKIKTLWAAYKATKGTQAEFALKAGLPESKQGQISDWLKAERPSADAVYWFAKGFGIPVSDLFPSETEHTLRLVEDERSVLLRDIQAKVLDLDKGELRRIQLRIDALFEERSLASPGDRKGEKPVG